MNPFDHQLLRLKQQLGVSTDTEVAERLGMTKTALAERKRRQAFPYDKVRALRATHPDIDLSYILGGYRAKPDDTHSQSGIHTRLREERRRLGMTQQVISEIGGVTKRTQIEYESAQTYPNAKYLSLIATAGANVNYIITGIRIPDQDTAPEPTAPERTTRTRVICAECGADTFLLFH